MHGRKTSAWTVMVDDESGTLSAGNGREAVHDIGCRSRWMRSCHHYRRLLRVEQIAVNLTVDPHSESYHGELKLFHRLNVLNHPFVVTCRGLRRTGNHVQMQFRDPVGTPKIRIHSLVCFARWLIDKANASHASVIGSLRLTHLSLHPCNGRST